MKMNSARKYMALMFVQTICLAIVCLLHISGYSLKLTNQDGDVVKIPNIRSLNGPYMESGFWNREREEDNNPVDRETKGAFSGCSLADIEKRPNVILLATTNAGFLDITLNMLYSIKRIGVCVNTTIVAEDDTAYGYLSKVAKYDSAASVIKTSSGDISSDKLSWNTPIYLQLVAKRHAYVLSLLRQGFDVLFCDSDNFFFRDPFPYLEGNFDIAMFDESGSYPVRNQEKSLYCAGFAYYKSTEATIQFVDTFVKNLEKDPTIPDQVVLNDMLRADEPTHLNIRSLKPEYFPGGMLYYAINKKGFNPWRWLHDDPVVMHSSAVFGHDGKVAKYREENIWLVAGNFSELLDV